MIIELWGLTTDNSLFYSICRFHPFLFFSSLPLRFFRHHSHHSGLVLCSLPILQPPRELDHPGAPHRSLLTACSCHWAQQLAHRLRQPVPPRGLWAPLLSDKDVITTDCQTQNHTHIGLDCSTVILIAGDHVLPNALSTPGGVPPSPQPTLPHAFPHRPGPVRVTHFPGPIEPHQAEWADILVQKPEAVLLQRALGAVWLQVCYSCECSCVHVYISQYLTLSGFHWFKWGTHAIIHSLVIWWSGERTATKKRIKCSKTTSNFNIHNRKQELLLHWVSAACSASKNPCNVYVSLKKWAALQSSRTSKASLSVLP